MKSLFIVATVIVLSSLGFGQVKEPKDVPDKLKLSPTEIESIQQANVAAKSLGALLNDALKDVPNIHTSPQAEVFGWKIAKILTDLAAMTKIIEDVQKAHDCAGCSILEGKLVKTPEK